jgi:hypothetical protein
VLQGRKETLQTAEISLPHDAKKQGYEGGLIAFKALFSAVFRERRKRDLNPISLPGIIDIYCVSFGSCCKSCCTASAM